MTMQDEVNPTSSRRTSERRAELAPAITSEEEDIDASDKYGGIYNKNSTVTKNKKNVKNFLFILFCAHLFVTLNKLLAFDITK